MSGSAVRLESTGVPGIVSAQCGREFFILMMVGGDAWAVYTGSGGRKLGEARSLPAALDLLVSVVAPRGRHVA